MRTSEADRCPRCGAVIPAHASETLCHACLLSGVLEPSKAQTETLSAAWPRSHAPGESLALPAVFGPYRLVRLLGRGGMGVVYEAEQRETGRRVALKTLAQRLDSPEMRRRFLREGRLAARVNHPNSVYVFGSEEIQGIPVITMEIAGAGTLKDRLKHQGPLPVPQAVDAMLDVIAGLEAAAEHGVLHRDIKPSNCFLSPDGSVKVGDFGLSVSTLARSDTLVTAHGQIMGTPAYAAPEQLRGDELDVRADIYAAGATLFSLLTNRPPFEGDNAVQVVANAVQQAPPSLRELRGDVPPGLERIVHRCLAKEPDARYAGYAALRSALLPFCSSQPEPATLVVRLAAGWIDYLLAFLPPYLILMFLVGAEQLLVRPLVDRTLFSARYYFLLLGLGLLYFTLAEGLWGGGLGKWLKGLRVTRGDNRRPGLGRGLLRILIPIGCCEGVRFPLMLALISDSAWTGPQTIMFVLGFVLCGWLPVVLTCTGRRENGFATAWDLASGTRVVVGRQGTRRPCLASPAPPAPAVEATQSLGPYRVREERISGQWLVAVDPVLERAVWLLRRTEDGLSAGRRNVARPGRLRWLQKVEAEGLTWDAFEAPHGVPLLHLVEGGGRIPWQTLRYWLHDLASELWEATGDGTLPAVLGLDQVWVTSEGRAVLLDRPASDVEASALPGVAGDLAGQQRFLHSLAGFVEPTSVPLHARALLRNLEDARVERLSFLTGTLRGQLERPADVGWGIRAGSIFMLPLYVWVAVLVGWAHDKELRLLGETLVVTALLVLGVIALVQFLTLPLGSTIGHSIFRLAVVDDRGAQAGTGRLLVRWAVVWLPVALAACLLLLPGVTTGLAIPSVLGLLLAWIAAAVYAVVRPHRGIQDRLAGTWVVRQ